MRAMCYESQIPAKFDHVVNLKVTWSTSRSRGQPHRQPRGQLRGDVIGQ